MSLPDQHPIDIPAVRGYAGNTPAGPLPGLREGENHPMFLRIGMIIVLGMILGSYTLPASITPDATGVPQLRLTPIASRL